MQGWGQHETLQVCPSPSFFPQNPRGLIPLICSSFAKREWLAFLLFKMFTKVASPAPGAVHTAALLSCEGTLLALASSSGRCRWEWCGHHRGSAVTQGSCSGSGWFLLSKCWLSSCSTRDLPAQRGETHQAGYQHPTGNVSSRNVREERTEGFTAALAISVIYFLKL